MFLGCSEVGASKLGLPRLEVSAALRIIIQRGAITTTQHSLIHHILLDTNDWTACGQDRPKHVANKAAAFRHIKDVRCEANLQPLWRDVFYSCIIRIIMEQPSS